MYVVKYEGTFGYIKPQFAVRDDETISQKFLNPSTVKGIERKLFPELLQNDDGELHYIKGYRLNFQDISLQTETVKSAGRTKKVLKTAPNGEKYYLIKNTGVLSRGLLINPELYLFFDSANKAAKALQQTICLCRNEDLMFPMSLFETDNLEGIKGYELVHSDDGIFVGYDRYKDNAAMTGELKIYKDVYGVHRI